MRIFEYDTFNMTITQSIFPRLFYYICKVHQRVHYNGNTHTR
jgi:hypothetical protein